MKRGHLLLLGGTVVVGGMLLIASRRAGHRAYQGFLGPQVSTPGFTSGGFQTSPDIPTANCTPAGYAGSNQAMYCNPPGVECGFGQNCADARVNYCQRYGVGGVCHDQVGNTIGAVEGDQGLPGQGPIVGSGYDDLASTYGTAAASQMTGLSPQMGFAQPPNPYQQGGFGYGGYGFGYPQMPYGYPSPGMGFGMGYPMMGMGMGMGYPQMGYPSMGMGFGMNPMMGMGMGYPSYGYGMMPPMSPYGYY